MSKECDCIKKTAELIKKKFNEDERRPKGYTITEADWEHFSIYPKHRLYSKYIITSTFEKKDGSTSKPKKESVSIFYTYCPFCGKKFPTT